MKEDLQEMALLVAGAWCACVQLTHEHHRLAELDAVPLMHQSADAFPCSVALSEQAAASVAAAAECVCVQPAQYYTSG